MLAIELAKLPPPTPPSAAISSSTPKGVSGLDTAKPRSVAGIRRSPAETMVQLRPPKMATMKVYGKRSVAPTRLGSEISQNASELDRVNPAPGSITTTIDQSCQMMKPRNSAKIDQPRLRRAMGRPSLCQNFGSSGSHPSIQRPARWTSTVPSRDAGAAGAAVGDVVAEVVMAILVFVGRYASTLRTVCFGSTVRAVTLSSPRGHAARGGR